LHVLHIHGEQQARLTRWVAPAVLRLQVVEVGKKFFSKTMATAFDDPRVKLLIDDAARYLREEGPGQNYDVIICDSSDPVGPADVLFQPEFFRSMKNALNPKTGVICTQGECQWLHLDFIAGVIGKVRGLFPSVKYAYTTIPTYPSGQIGFLIASVDAENDPSGMQALCTTQLSLQSISEKSEVYDALWCYCALLRRLFAENIVSLYVPPVCKREVAADMSLRYYSQEIHGTAFVLPGERRSRACIVCVEGCSLHYAMPYAPTNFVLRILQPSPREC
jgi:spermidine synthase